MTCADQLERRRICGVLGHELRNPLSSAVANLAVAARMTDSADPRRSFLEQSIGDLERMSGLLSSYLDWALTSRPRRSRVSVEAVLREAQARVRVDVAIECAAGIEVRGDAALLSRAVENLLENAATAGADSVDIVARVEGFDVAVYISDDGPGIGHEVRDRMFEPFVSGSGGSGLGLAVTRDVLAAHDATIELLPSEGGARFRLTLPVAH